MDYESLSYQELAREYESIHGERITAAALAYRVKSNCLSKTEAVQKSKDRRGETHREERDLLYCYLRWNYLRDRNMTLRWFDSILKNRHWLVALLFVFKILGVLIISSLKRLGMDKAVVSRLFLVISKVMRLDLFGKSKSLSTLMSKQPRRTSSVKLANRLPVDKWLG